MDADVEEAQSARPSTEQILQHDCESLWLNIYETHAKIQSRTENNNNILTSLNPEEKGETDVYRTILKAKEKKLQAACTALEGKGIDIPLDEEEFVAALVEEQLAKGKSELEDTLMIIKSQRKEVTEQIEREKEILEQHEDIQNTLLEKITKLENEKENTQSQNSEVKELERKARKTELQLKQLMNKLGSFIKEHFPVPSADDVKSNGKNSLHGKQVVEPGINYASLQQILEVLMNTLFDKPHDPYIRLEPRLWPPYIELLLRCGIIQRHPQDSNLVKLESFHL